MANRKGKEATREFTPLKVQKPDPNLIACRQCSHRDRSVIEINDKVIFVGVTKGVCAVFKGPPADNGKPLDVLFQNKRCPRFVKDSIEKIN